MVHDNLFEKYPRFWWSWKILCSNNLAYILPLGHPTLTLDILSRILNLIFIHLNPAWNSIIFRNCQICNSFGFKNDIMITDDFNSFKMSLAFCAPQTGCPLFRWRHLLSIGLWNSSRAGSDEIQKNCFFFQMFKVHC